MPTHPHLPLLLSTALLAVAGCVSEPSPARPRPRAVTTPKAEAADAHAASAPAPAAAPLCPAAAVLETRTMAVAPKGVATTVGLIDAKGIGVASGSGVLVSADGLILTAAHVVGKPGTSLGIRFNDGRVAKGIALGINRSTDSGMARITDAPPPGGWPFSMMGADASAAPGEWVLATGNPGGIVLGRDPPLRLGRVSVHDAVRIQSDCTVVSGDSGGPLFNLAGEVVGIHSNISINIHENRHVPIGVFRAQWTDLLAGKNILPTAGGGMMAPPPVAEDDDDDSPPPGAKPVPAPINARESRLQASRMARRLGETSLPALALFVPALEAAGDCAVEIRAYGQPVLMGTVVDADGWILTKASDLKTSAPQVVLADGRALIAKIVGQDPDTDLALLKIEASGLTAATFATAPARLGAWLVSPMRNPNQPAVSLVSLAARPIPQAFTHFYGEQKIMLGLSPKRRRACVVGAVLPGMPAARAGFRPDDEIVALNGKPIADWAGFQDQLKDARSGDMLTVKVRRHGKELELKPVLGAAKTAAATGDGIGEADALAGGRLSRRRTNFPSAIQHDAVIWADQCGGPLLDLQGRAVGINIARYDRVCTFALPAALVQKTLARLRAPQPATAPAAPAAPTGIKLPALPAPK